MSTRGDKLVLEGRPELAEGVSVPPLAVEEMQEVLYSSWQRGIYTQDAPEDIPKDSAQLASDTRIDPSDSLVRVEGISLREDATPRSLLYIFQHASLDFTTELVVIDPPFVGFRGGSSAFEFDDLTIAATGTVGWNVVNVAGDFVFSNGRTATYVRHPGDSTVTDISADIIAETFCTAFGRVFAGAFTDSITGLQSLAIVWNGTDSPAYADFASTNAGGELLISNNMEADRVIALRPIGFDAIAVLTRRAVWMGVPTGQVDHPAQFRLRFPGRGCVAEPTAAVVPNGVMYLNDDGVSFCNLNTAEIVSSEINSLLLPIDYLQIKKYRAVYQPVRDRYILQTPTGVWYYEFQKIDVNGQVKIPSRWYFSSFQGDSLVIFTDQSGNVYWNTVVGTWDDQDLTWNEMSIIPDNAPPLLYFTAGTKLGFEDPGAETYFDAAQDASWTTQENLPHQSDQVSTLWFSVEYRSGEESQVEFATRDSDEEFTNTRIITLPSTIGKLKNVVFGFTGVGTGTTLRLRFVSGQCAISRVRQSFTNAGPKQQAIA